MNVAPPRSGWRCFAPVLAVVVALVISAIVIALLGEVNPFDASSR